MIDEMRIIKCAPHPQRWLKFAGDHALAWQTVPFRTGGSLAVPAHGGFYCFVVGNSAVQLPLVLFPLYAGETDNLRRRYRDYLREKDAAAGRWHVRKFLKVFWGEVAFAFAPLDVDLAERRRIELELNDALLPPYSKRDFSAKVKKKKGAWQQ
jgi:hypothetical protein